MRSFDYLHKNPSSLKNRQRNEIWFPNSARRGVDIDAIDIYSYLCIQHSGLINMLKTKYFLIWRHLYYFNHVVRLESVLEFTLGLPPDWIT